MGRPQQLAAGILPLSFEWCNHRWVTTLTSYLCWYWAIPNSSPHACEVSALTTEPPLQAPMWLFVCQSGWYPGPCQKLAAEEILCALSVFVPVPCLVWQQSHGSLRVGTCLVHLLVDRTFCLTRSLSSWKAAWPLTSWLNWHFSSPRVSIYNFFRPWIQWGEASLADVKFESWESAALWQRRINTLVPATSLWLRHE